MVMRLDSRAAITCHEYLHKSYAPNCFDLSDRASLSDVAQAMADQGFIHEARVIDFLKQNVAGLVVIDDKLDAPTREAQTVDALKDAEIRIIVHPVFGPTAEELIAGEIGDPASGESVRVSRPDLLVRQTTEPAPFGTWSAVDVKSHGAFDSSNKSNQVQLVPATDLISDAPAVSGRLKQEDAMQLAHYQRHLEYMGIADAQARAGIIGRDIERIAWGSLSSTVSGRGKNAISVLATYDLEFARSLQVVSAAVERNQNPTLPTPAIPMWDADAKKCPTCEFKNICIEELVAYKGSGHVTLLAGVTPAKAEDHLSGLDSIAELAEVPSGSAFVEESAQRARVYLSGEHELKLGLTDLIIPTFDVEIDIDLENSQGVLQDLGFDESVTPDRLYLYGYITHDRTVESDWRESDIGTFENYEGTREGEHSVYGQMWEYLHDQITSAESAGKTVGIFHYSPHELTWWCKWARDFGDMTGTPTSDEVESFISKYCVDLLPIAKQVVFAPNTKSPICNYSIKTLAPIAGFNWMLDDAGGANSLLKYSQAIGADPQVAQEARDWLRQYNMDDVRATMALRNWLRENSTKL